MPSTRKAKEYHRAFRVTAGDILAVWNVVKDAGGELSLHLECSDGSTITREEVESLNEFPNAAGRRIVGITVASDYRAQPRIAVSISATHGEPYSKYEISGEDRDVTLASQRIEERLAVMVPWWSSLSVLKPQLEGALSALFWMAGMAIGSGGMAIWLNHPTLILGDVRFAIVLTGVGWCMFVFAFAGKRIVRLLFPAAIFLIGDGKSLDERAKRLRKVAAGIAAPAIFAILSLLWSKASL